MEQVAHSVAGRMRETLARLAGGTVLRCAAPGCGRAAVCHAMFRHDGIVLGTDWLCSPGCFRLAIARVIGKPPRASEFSRSTRATFRSQLLRNGDVSTEQLDEAERWARMQGVSLADALLALEHITETQLGAALAAEAGCGYCAQPPSENVAAASQLSALLGKHFGAAVVHASPSRLLLGFRRKVDARLARALEQMSGLRVESCIVADAVWRRQQPGSQTLIAAARDYASVEELTRGLLDAALGHRAETARVVQAAEMVWARFWNAEGGFIDVVCRAEPLRVDSWMQHKNEKKKIQAP